MKYFNTILAALSLALNSWSGAQTGSQGQYPAYSGDKKIAILMLSWSDRACPGTRQTMVNRIWNDSGSLRKYYLDVSRGALDFIPPADAAPDGTVPANTSSVYGPYELSIEAGFSQDVTVANAEDLYGGTYLYGTQPVARDLAAADGFNASDYDYIMYVTPKGATAGGLGGYAGVNATYSHMLDVRQNYINHELGHNLGLAHSNTSVDTNGYGSQDCIMGNGANAHLDSVHTYNMGWFPDTNFSVESYGQYDIENLAQPGTDNLKVLRFDRAVHGGIENPSYNFWVAYRVKGIGQDAGLSNNWNRKVNVHYCKAASPRPTDSNYYYYFNNNVSWFGPRESYTGPDNTCTIRFVRENSSNTHATVQLIDPNGNQPPSLVAEQNYRVGIGSSNFTVLATDPENDSLSYTIVSAPSTGTLTNNGSTFTYTGSSLGSYQFTVRVNDGQYDSYDETLTLTVVGASAPVINAGPDQTLIYNPNLPWTPAVTPACLWLDGADASTITETGGAVSQWNDKSGNNNHAVQSSSSRQPAYDSPNNKLSFDGGDIMQISNDPFYGLQNFAVIALQKWDSPSGWGNTSVSYHGESGIGWQIRQRSGSYDQFTFTRRGTSGGDDPSPNSTLNSSDFIGVGLRQNNKDMAIRHNGTQTYSTTNDTGTITYEGTNYSSIGGRFGSENWGGPANHLNGDLKEILVIENALTTDVEKAEGYLAHKWGMTSSLPAEHPYKTDSPTGPPASAVLNGSASDADGDVLSTNWSAISGPGTVNFTDASNVSTVASFPEPGSYTLRFSATDGLQTVTDDIIIHVIGDNGPEIGVSANSFEIASGDSTPELQDGTDYGTVSAGSNAATTFTIGNFGNLDLELSGSPIVTITGSSAFTVTSQPTTPIVTTLSPSPSVGSSDFVITFSPSDNEPQTATLSISSNDSDEPVYTFSIAGNLPSVDVIASDASADEQGPDTGTWTFTRSGGTAAPLSVNYTLSGTAIDGTDYTVSPMNQVVIPAGSNSATVTLTPISDSEFELPETASLSITDAAAYLVGNRSDTIQITEPDNVRATSPNGGQTLVAGSSYDINWLSLAGGNVKIELLKAGSFDSEIASSTPNDGSFEWTPSLDLAAGDDYRVRISLLPGGTVNDVSDADFSIILDPLAAALDAPELVMITSGDTDWFSQTTTTHDGVDAAQAGPIPSSQTTSMETTLMGPGTLTFWWKVSSESNFDYLRFSINNVEQEGALAPISGIVDWVQKTVTIPSGSHTIKWSYTKDGSASRNSDTGWVDQVVFTPDSANYTVSYLDNGSDDGAAPVDGNAYSLGASVTVLGNTGSLTRSGYSFSGWNTAANGSGASYSAADTFIITEDVTLHAQWLQSFAGWGGGVAFGDDANGDGMPNGMAWLLGAADPNMNANHLRPRPSVGDQLQPDVQGGPDLIMDFTCRKSAFRLGASLKVQASDDLGASASWTSQEVEVPDTSQTINGINFTISPHSNPELIEVRASISGASGGKFFGRLQAQP